jgi:hypothetical protein
MPNKGAQRETAKTGSAAGHLRAGRPEKKTILIGGRPVTANALKRDVDRGWMAFWARRGFAVPAAQPGHGGTAVARRVEQ